MFLLSTCCDVCLFVGFCMGDSDGSATSFVIHDNGFLFYCTWFKVAHSKSTRHIDMMYRLSNGLYGN